MVRNDWSFVGNIVLWLADCSERRATPPSKKRPYVKKPLNAFMLFMKEQRQKVIDESTLKESAAINQILGRKVSKLGHMQYIGHQVIYATLVFKAW